MSLSFISAGALVENYGTSIQPVLPSHLAGDLLIVMVATCGPLNSAGLVSTPSGWSILFDTRPSTVEIEGIVFTKPATGTDTNPSIPFSISTYAVAQAFVFRGVNSSSYIIPYNTTTTGTGGSYGAGNPHSSLAFTSTYPNSFALAFDFSFSPAYQNTAPSGWTLDSATGDLVTTDLCLSLFHKQLGGTGSSSGAINVSEPGPPYYWVQNQAELVALQNFPRYAQGTIAGTSLVSGVGDSLLDSGTGFIYGNAVVSGTGVTVKSTQGNISGTSPVSGVGALVTRAVGTIFGQAVMSGGGANIMPYLSGPPNFQAIRIVVPPGQDLNVKLNFLMDTTATPINISDVNFGTFSLLFWDGRQARVLFPSGGNDLIVSGNSLTLYCPAGVLAYEFPIGSYFQGDLALLPPPAAPQFLLNPLSVVLLRAPVDGRVVSEFNVYCSIGYVVQIKDVYTLENETTLLDRFRDPLSDTEGDPLISLDTNPYGTGSIAGTSQILGLSAAYKEAHSSIAAPSAVSGVSHSLFGSRGSISGAATLLGKPLINAGTLLVQATPQSGLSGMLILNGFGVISAPATIQSLSVYCGAVSGTIQLALYSAISPFQRVALSSSFAPTPNAWNTVTVSPTLLAAGPYYVAVEISSNVTTLYFGGTGVSEYYTNETYGTFPSSLNASDMSSAAEAYSMYSTWTGA